MQTATKVVDRSAYTAQIEGWKEFARERGAKQFAIVYDLRDNIFRCFPLVEGETEETIRQDFDGGRYYTLKEIIDVEETSPMS